MSIFKRYLLFGHDSYYPSGGWGDYQGTFDTPEEAKAFIQAQKYRRDAYDLIDSHTGEDCWQELGL